MKQDSDAKVLLALVSLDTALSILSIFGWISAAITIGSFVMLLGMAAVATDHGGSYAGLLGSLIPAVKGIVLVYAIFQVEKLRKTCRTLWSEREEFFWQKSLQEDKDTWFIAGIQATVVVLLFACAF